MGAGRWPRVLAATIGSATSTAIRQVAGRTQEYQRKERLKRLLRNAPTMNEARVVELMTAAEFAEFPDDLKQALSDRMLQLEIEPD